MQEFIADDTLAKVANALGFICAVLVAFLAYSKKQPKADSSNAVEVAGALIDSASANKIIRSLDKNTQAHRDHSDQIRMLRESLDDTTRDLNRLRDAILVANRGQ